MHEDKVNFDGFLFFVGFLLDQSEVGFVTFSEVLLTFTYFFLGFGEVTGLGAVDGLDVEGACHSDGGNDFETYDVNVIH